MKSVTDCNSIEDIRNAIDELDKKIIGLIGQRFCYVKEIVKYKDNSKDSIIAKERLEAVIKSRRVLAEENGLDAEVIEDIYRKLIRYFISEELKLMNNKKDLK